ncbi:MAG: O-antigen ligase family protein [Bacteroidales bacterium]|nr:O-antigen ligase family protein [Bacteroidales bacterium]
MTRSRIHHIIYLFLLFAMAASIPVSNFAMSATGIFMAANWLVEGEWKTKWERLKQNKLALILSSFFIVFLLGLFNTDNWSVGLDNVLSKLPLLYAPLIMASSERPTPRAQRLIVGAFVGSTFVGTCIALCQLCGNQLSDYRQMSMFISHIRFGLSVVLSFFFAMFFAVKCEVGKIYIRPISICLGIWFVVYLFVAQTVTSIVLLLILLLVVGIYLLMTKSCYAWWRKLVLGEIALVTIVVLSWIGKVTWDYFHYEKVEEYASLTANGNPYEHDDSSIIENGCPIGIYVCEPELRATWALRSEVPYDSVSQTLIRYLNSKGFRKDAQGVSMLSAKDISNVEHLIANVDYTQFFGVKRALYPTFFSLSLYQKNHCVAHSSLLQRVVLWKVSLKVIAEHWLTGVGIGDHKAAIDEQLVAEAYDMPMNMGSHNQYLTFAVMGGVMMFIFFVSLLFVPLLYEKPHDLLYLLFFLIVFLSCFTEDTIETQAGITFYAFFNAFLLFCYQKKEIYQNSANNI